MKNLRDLQEARASLGNEVPRTLLALLDFQSSKSAQKVGTQVPEEWRPFFDGVTLLEELSYSNYGASLKSAFRSAIHEGYDQILVLPLEATASPESFASLLFGSFVHKKSVVFGSRFNSGSKLDLPLGYRINAKLLTKLQNLLLGMHHNDFFSNCRLYQTSIIKKIPFELNNDDAHFNFQIMIQLRNLGVSITEAPISVGSGTESGPFFALNQFLFIIRSVLQYRLHQVGLQFDERYVPKGLPLYTIKKSPYSSHGQILNLVNNGTDILDVGCGTGLLSQSLAEKGVRALGIDYEIKENVWAGFETYIQDDLEKAEKLPQDKTFDYVILADVLEHLRTPSELLRKVKPLLKPKGKLIASTGNVALWFVRLSLLVGRFNYGKKGILDETHVRLYTQASFLRLLRNAGYQVEIMRVTSLPFEVVFQSTGRSQILHLIDWLYYRLANLLPRMFAYQFVVLANTTKKEVLLEPEP